VHKNARAISSFSHCSHKSCTKCDYSYNAFIAILSKVRAHAVVSNRLSEWKLLIEAIEDRYKGRNGLLNAIRKWELAQKQTENCSWYEKSGGGGGGVVMPPAPTDLPVAAPPALAASRKSAKKPGVATQSTPILGVQSQEWSHSQQSQPQPQPQPQPVQTNAPRNTQLSSFVDLTDDD
jgi:hypothetical protein